MSLLTVDLGGANETVIPFVRAGNAERRQIGKKRYAFAGNERSMIRAERIVLPVQLIAIPAATAATIRALFALGAAVNCEGDVFNNGNATIACLGEITDEMEVGGVYWNLSLTLREVDAASSTAVDPVSGVSTLMRWYDTQGANFAALALSNTDPVILWPDESGNGVDAPAGNASFSGVLNTTALNGNPGVYLEALGNNQRGYGMSPNTYTPTEGEAFVVMRADIPGVGGGGAFWAFGETAVGPSVPNVTGGTFRDNFGSTTARSFTMPVDPTDPFLYHVRSRAGQFRAWINGTLVYSSAINTQNWAGNNSFGMWLAGGAFYTAYVGWLGELKFYSGFMDPSTAAAEEAALMTKWGIP